MYNYITSIILNKRKVGSYPINIQSIFKINRSGKPANRKIPSLAICAVLHLAKQLQPSPCSANTSANAPSCADTMDFSNPKNQHSITKKGSRTLPSNY